MTITEKRAKLLREWILAKLANDETYYECTLMDGIPDGDDYATVLNDLSDGVYDDDIDYTIGVYLNAKAAFGDAGYFVIHNIAHRHISSSREYTELFVNTSSLIYDEDEALMYAGYELPTRIRKRRGEN